MQSMKRLNNPLAWGTAALAILTAVTVTIALLYLSPPGQKTITFYTDDAASVRPGIPVRIAGIAVGEVEDLSLESDRVQVHARLNNSVFVGNKSEVQVRMLTVVGGYYVNLVPLGDIPLGSSPIPPERVTMPYSLVRTLSDSTKLTENLDPKPINEALNQIQQGLSGSNVDSLNAAVDAGNALMSTIDRQRGQLTKIFNLSDEYLRTLADFRGTFEEMVHKVAIVEATLDLYSRGFGQSLDRLGDALSRVKPVGVFYFNHRDEFLEKVRNLLEKGRMWVQRSDLIVRALKWGQRRLDRILAAENAPPELLATDLCFPIPGSPCR